MSTKAEDQKTEEQNTEVQEQEQPQEEVEPEEPVDIELQKQMQNAKIDESAFTQTSSNKKQKKEKEKSKKNKGEDFYDYANKNQIKYDIQYEEDKYGARDKKEDEKKTYEKRPQKGGNKPYNNNKYQKNKNFTQNPNGNKYGGRPQQGYYQNKRPQFRFGGNKFDACNLQRPYENIPNQFPPRQNPVLKSDEDITKFIQEMFSEQNLNKDIYLRLKMSEENKIDIQYILNYYPIKNNQITLDKWIEIIGKVETLEMKDEGEKKMVEIKNFKDMKLNTVEEISAAKRQMKMQRMQQNEVYQQGPYMNYIHLQNNFIIPMQGCYPMPGYNQPPMYMQPQQQPQVQQPQPQAQPQPQNP